MSKRTNFMRSVEAGRAGSALENEIKTELNDIGWQVVPITCTDDYGGGKTDVITRCPNEKKLPIQASLQGKSKKALESLKKKGVTQVTSRDIGSVGVKLCSECPLNKKCDSSLANSR